MLAGIGFQKSKKLKETGYFWENIAQGGSEILNENDTK